MNATLRNFSLWIIIVVLLLALFTLFQNPGIHPPSSNVELSYAKFLAEVDAGKVRDVVFEIRGNFNDGRGGFRADAGVDASLLLRLNAKNVMMRSGAPR